MRPDLCVLDVGMPRMTGLQATREIRAHVPGTHVLILSMHDDERYLFEALKAGAAGYVLKREADQDARRRAARDRPRRAVPDQRGRARADPPVDGGERLGPDEPLTAREQQIVKLIAEAHTNAQIAATLHVVREDGRVAPRERAAQARHARPRRAGAVRDPARARRGVSGAAGSGSAYPWARCPPACA